MELVDKHISLERLTEMSGKMFHKLVKAVVDIEKGVMVVDAGMHCDQERYMLEELECEQKNLWGINLHPSKFGTDEFVEFDSMINLRPAEGNVSRGVDSPLVQKLILKIVAKLVQA